MIYLSENIRNFRKRLGMTQEEVAAALFVAPQSVSKWECAETTPDVELLPALANLFHTSIDALIGMDRINASEARNAVFQTAHDHFRCGEYVQAAEGLRSALRVFPNDACIACGLAFAQAFLPGKLAEAIRTLETVVAGSGSEKAAHTARAALSLLLLKAGQDERAREAASRLPHARESREEILNALRHPESLDDYLRYLVLGEGEAPAVQRPEVSISIAESAACP